MCIEEKFKKKIFYKYYLEYRFKNNCINNTVIKL